MNGLKMKKIKKTINATMEQMILRGFGYMQGIRNKKMCANGS